MTLTWETSYAIAVELKRRGRCAPFELECQGRDGRPLPILLGVALLDETRAVEPGSSLVAFCQGVPERKRLEDQLRAHASELAKADTRKNDAGAFLQSARVAHNRIPCADGLKSILHGLEIPCSVIDDSDHNKPLVEGS
jgi:hypothetical protein